MRSSLVLQGRRDGKRLANNDVSLIPRAATFGRVGVFMPRKQKLNWNVEELTDAEISEAIHYLDPDSSREVHGQGSSTLFVVSVCFLVLLLTCAVLLWLS